MVRQQNFKKHVELLQLLAACKRKVEILFFHVETYAFHKLKELNATHFFQKSCCNFLCFSRNSNKILSKNFFKNLKRYYAYIFQWSAENS